MYCSGKFWENWSCGFGHESSLAFWERINLCFDAEMRLRNPANYLSRSNGVDYIASEGAQPLVLGMGYQRGAVHLAKNAQLSYQLETQGADTVDLEITLAPNHPVEGKQIRLEVVVDKGISKTFDLKTKDRNEEWKMNVLNNKSTRTIRLIAKTRPMINVDIRALDEGIVIDQLILKKK
jgi:uncharacterized protein YueI